MTIDNELDRTLNEYNEVQENKWETPMPFEDESGVSFPITVLPSWLKDYSKALASQMLVPIDIPAMATITPLSTSISGKYDVYFAQTDWRQPLNTYIIQVAPPSSSKSGVHKEIMQPVEEYAAEKREVLELELRDNKQEYRAKKKLLEKLENKYADKQESKILDEMKALNNELAELEKKLRVPTFTTSGNITTEKLFHLLRDSDEKLTISTDEGFELISILSGKYSGKVDIDLLLKAFSGERATVERMKGDPIVLNRPLLTMGLFIQPSVLGELRAFNGRGFSERFLYSLKSPKYQEGFGVAIPKVIKDRYKENITKLLEMDDVGTITVSEEAYQRFTDLHNEIKREAFNEDYPEILQGWFGKLTGTILRIIALLHIAEEIDLNGKVISNELTSEDIEKGFALLPYLSSMTKTAFGIVGEDGTQRDLKYLFKRVCDLQDEGVTPYRKLYHAVKRRFKADKLKNALKELEDMNYIHLEEKSGDIKSIEVNPLTKDMKHKEEAVQEVKPVHFKPEVIEDKPLYEMKSDGSGLL
ncbi:YfjI family protein [Rossellomorea oryzaecorticis]|uniref:YfjI family protein n=1 Tax=Rossellomorea oryzaecorticis TaxID=1396505 RepID=A0ABU9KAD2_9BACI